MRTRSKVVCDFFRAEPLLLLHYLYLVTVTFDEWRSVSGVAHVLVTAPEEGCIVLLFYYIVTVTFEWSFAHDRHCACRVETVFWLLLREERGATTLCLPTNQCKM